MSLLRLAALVAAVLAAAPAVSATLTYRTILDGASEDPPNASPGTGTATVVYDTVARTLSVDFSFSGLLGTVTAAHIHGPTLVPGTGVAGVMTTTPTFPGTPVGVTSGSYSGVFDLQSEVSYSSLFLQTQDGVAGAEATLVAALAGRTSYLNIHTTSFPAGEIRGFLAPIPLPAGLPLVLAGLGALAALRGVRRLRLRAPARA